MQTVGNRKRRFDSYQASEEDIEEEPQNFFKIPLAVQTAQPV